VPSNQNRQAALRRHRSAQPYIAWYIDPSLRKEDVKAYKEEAEKNDWKQSN